MTWEFPTSTARRIVRTVDPFILDRMAVMYGLGHPKKEIQSALGFPVKGDTVWAGFISYVSEQVGFTSAIFSLELVLHRIWQHYASPEEARESARTLLWRCGARKPALLNTVGLIYDRGSITQLAKENGYQHEVSLRLYFAAIYRYTGSINRMNAAVRLAGISNEEWSVCKAQKGVFLWEQTST